MKWDAKKRAALLVIASGLTLSAAAAGELPGKGVTVQPADSNSVNEWFQEDLVIMGLQDLGYDVKESTSMQLQLTYLVASGDATFHAAYWDPSWRSGMWSTLKLYCRVIHRSKTHGLKSRSAASQSRRTFKVR
ncbi:hypothetical protein [Mesorhizobium sp.]|uniref:hypothetical protein n=1 Tax=Mesorhizobium sp. TaxID=1871066 RepID=UPI00121556A4|nr:hypothetical protein [Mesorhizobium sp.]TIL49595.1 MAG: hypothetical protein E5Y83_25535 [Mesorhizobium sp.]